MKQALLGVVFLFLAVSANASAAKISAGDWQKLGQEFQWGQQKLDGKWQEKQTWDAWLCQGFYRYDISLAAVLAKLDLQLTEKGYLIATADISDIRARAAGAYRSKATACLPVGGSLGASSPWAELRTEVHLGDSGDLEDIRLKILSTKLGRLEMGKLFPVWFEEFFTGVLNRALTVVWNSKMGAWLSEKITKIAKDHIPEPHRS